MESKSTKKTYSIFIKHYFLYPYVDPKYQFRENVVKIGLIVYTTELATDIQLYTHTYMQSLSKPHFLEVTAPKTDISVKNLVSIFYTISIFSLYY